MKHLYISEKKDFSGRDKNNFHLSILKGETCLSSFNETTYYASNDGKIQRSTKPPYLNLLKHNQTHSSLTKLYLILNIEAHAEWNRIFK